jgi:hypothetical protein
MLMWYNTNVNVVQYNTNVNVVQYNINVNVIQYNTNVNVVQYNTHVNVVKYNTNVNVVQYNTNVNVVQYNTNVNAPLVFCTWLKSWFHLQLLNYIDHIKFIPGFSSCYSIFSFMCRSLFVLFPFHLAIVLSVRRSTDSDYPFCVFKLFLQIILFDLRLLLLQNPLWKRKRWAYIFQVSY